MFALMNLFNSLFFFLIGFSGDFSEPEEVSERPEIDSRFGQHHIQETEMGNISIGISEIKKDSSTGSFEGIGEFGLVFEKETKEILPKLVSLKPFIRNHFAKNVDETSFSERLGLGLETRWRRPNSLNSIVVRVTVDEADDQYFDPDDELVYSAGAFYELALDDSLQSDELINRIRRLSEPSAVQIRVSRYFRNLDPGLEERQLFHYILFSQYIALIQAFQEKLDIKDQAFPFREGVSNSSSLLDIETWVLDRIVDRYPLYLCSEQGFPYTCERLSDIQASNSLLWDPLTALSDFLILFENEFFKKP